MRRFWISWLEQEDKQADKLWLIPEGKKSFPLIFGKLCIFMPEL